MKGPPVLLAAYVLDPRSLRVACGLPTWPWLFVIGVWTNGTSDTGSTAPSRAAPHHTASLQDRRGCQRDESPSTSPTTMAQVPSALTS